MLIPSQIFPISKICDVETTRYALSGVRLERDAEGPVAIATDGRRLIAVRWSEDVAYPSEVGDVAEVAGFETMIPKKQWDEAAKMPPKPSKYLSEKALRNVLVEEPSANGTVRMLAADREKNTKEIKATVPQGRFPRWRDVMPKEQPGSITVRLDAAYLAEVCAVLAKMVTNDSSRGVDITFAHEDRAVTITKTLNGVSATAVIMPLCRQS